MTTAKIGRPSKGKRDHLVTHAASLPLRRQIILSWLETDYDSVSDYVAAILAREVGLAEEAPPTRPTLVGRDRRLPDPTTRQLVTRPPIKVGEAVRDSWTRCGYTSQSEYIAAVLAVHEGMPSEAPAPSRRGSQKEALAISA